MKIKKVILSGNTRLALGGKSCIEYTPEKDFQLIVGTNGSGKSSLLQECTILPPNANDYEKGGYKYTLSEHNGNVYETKSEFNASNKHSFKRNGVELNPGGTLTIQKELIKQETGLTPEIHSLITDQLKFTDMSPSTRRYWISLFCTTDLSYATSLFNSMKSKTRDTVGAIKHLTNRLSVETNKLLEFDDIEKLEIRAKSLREELNVLMENRDTGLPGLWDEEQQLSDNLVKLESLSRQVLELKVVPPHDSNLPEEHEIRHVDEALSELRQEIGITESMLVHYSTEYSDLDGILKTLNDSGADGVEELEQRIYALTVEEEGAMDSIRRFLVEDNPDDARDDSRIAIETIVGLLDALPKDSAAYISPTTFMSLKDTFNDAQYEVTKIQNRIRTMETRLEHIQHAKDNTCPKCQYVWKDGVSEGDVLVLEESLTNHRLRLTEAQTVLTTLSVELEKAEETVSYIKQYRYNTAAYPRLQPLWDFISNNNLLQSPVEATVVAYQWLEDIHTSCTIHSIRKEKQSLREALEHARRLNQNDSGMFGDRVKTLQEKIETTTLKLQGLRASAQRLKDYHEVLKRLATLKGEIVRLAAKIDESAIMIQRIYRNDLIGDTIGKNQSTLALVQASLNEKNTIEGIVKDLQESHDRLIIEREAFQVICDMLSPTEGLIAEQLMGAIHSITTYMNGIIAAIWTYDLVIQDCGTDNGELDYKFPVLVETPDTIRADVSLGSSSILDIVNFAFKLLAYSHLKLENFPLYLDEFGRTFDPEHVKRAMSYVQWSLESHAYSQIFMISHFENYYESFSNADVLLLHSNNVSLPCEHNQHVSFS